MPRAVWRFDGDYTEEIAGMDAMMVGGSESFVTSPDGHAAVVEPGAYIDASAAGPLVLDSLGELSVYTRVRFDDNVGDMFLWVLGQAGNTQAPADNSLALKNNTGALQVFTETGTDGTDHIADLGYFVPAGTGEWIDIVATFDGATVRAYIDGELAAEVAYVAAETTSIDFYIGGIENPGAPTMTEHVHGPIDEMRIWDTVLTADQVSAVSQQE